MMPSAENVALKRAKAHHSEKTLEHPAICRSLSFLGLQQLLGDCAPLVVVHMALMSRSRSNMPGTKRGGSCAKATHHFTSMFALV
eukprot:5450233-Amphidinium_carterae.1